MCLTGQKAPFTRGQSGPQRRAPNRRRVNTVSAEPIQDEDDSSSDEEYVYTLGHKPGMMRVPETNVEIDGVTMKMMIDTGASTDIIDETAFEKIKRTCATQLEKDTCHVVYLPTVHKLP